MKREEKVQNALIIKNQIKEKKVIYQIILGKKGKWKRTIFLREEPARKRKVTVLRHFAKHKRYKKLRLKPSLLKRDE